MRGGQGFPGEKPYRRLKSTMHVLLDCTAYYAEPPAYAKAGLVIRDGR